jgi:hypothetical protein
VSHCDLAISITKVSGCKRRIMETQTFQHAKRKKKTNLQKNPLIETKIFQDIITLHLISSFNTGQNIIFQKSSYKNRPIIQNSEMRE